MTSGVRVCCTLSAENCFLDDNKKGEAVADDKDIVAPKLSAIVRHMHGDTGVVPNGTSVPSCSAYKKLLQRPSQPPPPPPPCPYGDSAEDENTIIPAGERHFMMPSPALMTGLQLQQQQQQQPRYRYRPGQRSPLRQTSKNQQTLQSKDKDEKHEDENATAAAGGRTAVSSSEAPIDDVLRDAVDDLDRTAAADGDPQKLLRLTEDAADREMDDVAAAAALDSAAAAAVDSSSEHVDDGTHSSAIQTSELVGLIPVTTSNDDVDRCSSGGPQWIKRRPCAVIVEEASLDELLEKTEKLEQELRKQLDTKKQKTLDIARQEERIRVLERINSELKMELTAKESELTKKDIKIAVIEEKNENLAKRLKSTQDVLAKLENDYERVVEDKLEFKSLYIDGRLRASEAIGDLTEEINRQIEAKRSFIRLAQQNITTRSANGLKKALATTSDYLHLKCERNRLLDKVQYLKTRLEAQDLYIEDLSSAVRELSRIIQYYNVPLPCMEERAEIEQWEHRKPDDEDHSSMGRCATMSDYSSGEESATFESTTRRPEEEEIEYQPNEEDDLEKELEDICGQTSDSDGRTETTEESIVLEFRTPLSSPSPTIKSQTLRETTADEDDTGDYDDGEE